MDHNDVPSLPCPKCGQKGLTYDGMLVWRSGKRPPRAWACKEVSFSLNADYEHERCYHCAMCDAEFFEDLENKQVHLYEEDDGQYSYDRATGTWTHEKRRLLTLMRKNNALK
jgi:DNA-directed RNA polymerase subunit RPC12/RpoP